MLRCGEGRPLRAAQVGTRERRAVGRGHAPNRGFEGIRRSLSRRRDRRERESHNARRTRRDETDERCDRHENVTRRFRRSGSRAHCSDETSEKGASRASVVAAPGLWRHQTGRIFSSGYGLIRLWTRAAPPPIRFARRRLRKICRSPSFEHVVPSAFVLKRRIRDVIAPLPTRGVRKQKRHHSRNPTSRLVGFSVLEKSYQFSRNPTSFSTGRIFRLEKSYQFLDW